MDNQQLINLIIEKLNIIDDIKLLEYIYTKVISMTEYQTLVLCHGKKHRKIKGLKGRAVYVDPSKKVEADVQDIFPSESFTKKYGHVIFNDALLMGCPFNVMVYSRENFTLKPDFWVNLNKSIKKKGKVYIYWACDILRNNPVKLTIESIKNNVSLYGFKYDKCTKSPYIRVNEFLNDKAHILIKINEV